MEEELSDEELFRSSDDEDYFVITNNNLIVNDNLTNNYNYTDIKVYEYENLNRIEKGLKMFISIGLDFIQNLRLKSWFLLFNSKVLILIGIIKVNLLFYRRFVKSNTV
jgi:hypothetical protein